MTERIHAKGPTMPTRIMPYSTLPWQRVRFSLCCTLKMATRSGRLSDRLGTSRASSASTSVDPLCLHDAESVGPRRSGLDAKV
jgi:hypothetical protein